MKRNKTKKIASRRFVEVVGNAVDADCAAWAWIRASSSDCHWAKRRAYCSGEGLKLNGIVDVVPVVVFGAQETVDWVGWTG